VQIKTLSLEVLEKMQHGRCRFNVVAVQRIIFTSRDTTLLQDLMSAFPDTCEICKFRLYKIGGGSCANKNFIARSS